MADDRNLADKAVDWITGDSPEKRQLNRSAADINNEIATRLSRTAYNPNADAYRLRYNAGGAFQEGRNLFGPAYQQLVASMRSAQQPFREGQLGLMEQLQAQAAGQGPSLATQQFQATTQQALGQAAALQASQRGVNPAMAARQAQMAQAGVQAQAAQQAALMRVQEQLAAREQLGGLMAQGRAGETALSGLELGAQQSLDQLTRDYMAMGLDEARASMAARVQLEQDRLNASGLNMQVPGTGHSPQFGPSWLQQLLAAGTGAYAAIGNN